MVLAENQRLLDASRRLASSTVPTAANTTNPAATAAASTANTPRSAEPVFTRLDERRIDTGSIVTGEVAPAPSETPRTPIPEAPDEKSHDQRIKETFRDGLSLMAHGTEDATDYIREREAQDKFLDGEDLSSSQMAAWHQRAQVALQRALDASARARGEVPPSQQQAPAEIPNYVAADAPDYDAHMGSAQGRVNEYFNSRTDIPDVQAYKDSITKVVTENDPRSELSGYFLAASNPGAMIEALAYEPDAINIW